VGLLNLAVSTAIAAAAAIPTIPTVKPSGPPTNGIVTATDGTVYFIDSFHKTVWRVNPSGRMTAFVTGRNGKSLQIDVEGNIYGTHDEGRGRISFWRADPAGTVIEIGRTTAPQVGHAFVLDGGGELIGIMGASKRTGVRIWRAHDDQRQLLAGGDWGFRDGVGPYAQFFPIGGMTLTHDGELYVTSGPSVRKIDRNGAVSTIARGDKLSARSTLLQRIFGEVHAHLTGISVDGDGTIYVANPGRDAVVRIDGGGRTTEVMTGDIGWSPTGVSASNGVLYVLEYGNGVRVRRVCNDGARTLVAMVPAGRVIASQSHHGRFIGFSS
jgi:sugar lactone lactonase YvrE